MSGDSSEEKTEAPSAKKLKDARKKGQVAKSQELGTAVSLLAGLLTVVGMLPWSTRRVADLWLAVDRSLAFPTSEGVMAVMLETLHLVIVLSLAPALVAASAATVMLWIQVGPVFAADTLMPKLERLNPAEGLKKLFGMKNLVSLAFMLLRTAVVGVAVVLVCRQVLPDAVRVIQGDVSAALAISRGALMHLLLWCGAAFVALGAVDLGYQRWQFMKDQRMSRSEQKREHRESEGEPHVKAERKRLASEPSSRELLKYLPYASILLKDRDGRVIAIVAKANISPKPLFLFRASGAVGVEALMLAAGRGIPSLDDDEIVALLYPVARSGEPVPEDGFALLMRNIRRARR